jgi:hypothetical protein
MEQIREKVLRYDEKLTALYEDWISRMNEQFEICPEGNQKVSSEPRGLIWFLQCTVLQQCSVGTCGHSKSLMALSYVSLNRLSSVVTYMRLLVSSYWFRAAIKKGLQPEQADMFNKVPKLAITLYIAFVITNPCAVL